ncbi:MarR family transcriptional regulator [Marinobacter sp.]|uniref:MarR family winged helix-turn-helix transcriptional regulator n=1 Tax=Marinobacter sp. TaxID=50741 RepID=UPI002B27A768|nr:MarR family transcriptional regulator [Marinobacter sp.]
MTSKSCSDTPSADQLMALDNQLCFALYAANRAVTARYRPLLKELNLTYPQYLVMLVLWQQDQSVQSPKVSELGQRLRLDSGTLTPLLKRLEERALVNRTRGTDDERVVRVCLTHSGRLLRAKAVSVPERLMCGVDVEPARIASLRGELRNLLEILERVEPSEQ